MSGGLRLGLGVAAWASILLAWWGASHGFAISPFVLPPPEQVLAGFVQVAQGYMGASLWAHVKASLGVVITGFLAAVIVGVPLGMILAWSVRADRILGPVVAVLSPIPPPAWIPLAILWFGIDLSGKAFVVFVSSVVPCIVNAQAAVREVPPTLLAAARTMGARGGRLLFAVVLPASLPSILTGVRVSLGVAWATVVAAELVVATAGLGFLVMNGYRNFEAHIMATAMVIIAAIGAMLDVAVSLATRRLLAWLPEAPR